MDDVLSLSMMAPVHDMYQCVFYILKVFFFEIWAALAGWPSWQ